MIKRIFFQAVFIVFILLLNFISALSEAEDKKVDKEVEIALNNQSEVRVFIKFKDINITRGLFFKRIVSSKEEIINKVGKGKINHNFDGLISANIKRGDLENLRADENVESIQMVGIRKLLLQDSVGLINASLSRGLQANGLNLTGKGQAICVIDTGINFSNPNLGGCYGNNSLSSTCKVIGGYDTVYEGSEELNIMDYDGHGTHVAGIIAANGSITGVAPEAKLVAISAYDYDFEVFWNDDIIA